MGPIKIENEAFQKFLIEECEKAKKPLNIREVARKFRKMKGSRKKVEALRAVARRYKEKIGDITDKNKRARQLFALSVKVDEDLKRKLERHARVVLNSDGKIIEYEAFDGSLKLKGDQSALAKLRTKKQTTRKAAAIKNNKDSSDLDSSDSDSSIDSRPPTTRKTRLRKPGASVRQPIQSTSKSSTASGQKSDANREIAELKKKLERIQKAAEDSHAQKRTAEVEHAQEKQKWEEERKELMEVQKKSQQAEATHQAAIEKLKMEAARDLEEKIKNQKVAISKLQEETNHQIDAIAKLPDSHQKDLIVNLLKQQIQRLEDIKRMPTEFCREEEKEEEEIEEIEEDKKNSGGESDDDNRQEHNHNTSSSGLQDGSQTQKEQSSNAFGSGQMSVEDFEMDFGPDLDEDSEDGLGSLTDFMKALGTGAAPEMAAEHQDPLAQEDEDPRASGLGRMPAEDNGEDMRPGPEDYDYNRQEHSPNTSSSGLQDGSQTQKEQAFDAFGSGQMSVEDIEMDSGSDLDEDSEDGLGPLTNFMEALGSSAVPEMAAEHKDPLAQEDEDGDSGAQEAGRLSPERGEFSGIPVWEMYQRASKMFEDLRKASLESSGSDSAEESSSAEEEAEEAEEGVLAEEAIFVDEHERGKQN